MNDKSESVNIKLLLPLAMFGIAMLMDDITTLVETLFSDMRC